MARHRRLAVLSPAIAAIAAAAPALTSTSRAASASISSPAPVRSVNISAAASGAEFLGARSDVPQLLRQSDVLVFTSRPDGEGMPGVLIEAGLSGLPTRPVLASGVRGRRGAGARLWRPLCLMDTARTGYGRHQMGEPHDHATSGIRGYVGSCAIMAAVPADHG